MPTRGCTAPGAAVTTSGGATLVTWLTVGKGDPRAAAATVTKINKRHVST